MEKWSIQGTAIAVTIALSVLAVHLDGAREANRDTNRAGEVLDVRHGDVGRIES